MNAAQRSARTTTLWHLLEEGCLTVAQLMALTGMTLRNTREGLETCIKQGLAIRDVPRSRPATYSLTSKGVDEALKLQRHQAHFAHVDARAQQQADVEALIQRLLEDGLAPGAAMERLLIAFCSMAAVHRELLPAALRSIEQAFGHLAGQLTAGTPGSARLH